MVANEVDYVVGVDTHRDERPDEIRERIASRPVSPDMAGAILSRA
jgi:hypothetical protein